MDSVPLSQGQLVVSGHAIAPLDALRFAFVASSGPGGQNVNKRATKCQLRVALADLRLTPQQHHRLVALAPGAVTDAGELLIISDEHKSQGRNQDECVDRLRDLIRRALVTPKVRRKTRPSRASKERRLEHKKQRSRIKRRRGSAED